MTDTNKPRRDGLTEAEKNQILNDPVLDGRLQPCGKANPQPAGRIHSETHPQERSDLSTGASRIHSVSENYLIAFVSLDKDPASGEISRSFIAREKTGGRILGFETSAAKLAESVLCQGFRGKIKLLTHHEIAKSDFEPKHLMDAFTDDEKQEFLAA